MRATAHSAHERQANAAAAGFVRHAGRLDRGLTPAPAAGDLVAASAGVPLGAALRDELEGRFNADFAAVRIHHDAAAADATFGRSARAFASGVHVYFGAGEFHPGSEAGRLLISHEIAHVLQQTARASHEGRWLAAPVFGVGSVQCQPKGDTVGIEYTDEQIEEQRMLFNELAGAYRPAKGASRDRDLEGAIDKVRGLTGGRLLPNQSAPAFGTPLKDAASRGEFAKLSSARARSFVFECLKLLGFYEEAARILETDTGFEMRVVTASGGFSDFLLTSPAFGRKWISRFLRHGDFSRIWPKVIVRGWRNFFLRPDKVDPLDADLKGQIDENFRRIQQLAGKPPPRLHAEHYYTAWRMIQILDDERRREASDLSQRFASLGTHKTLRELLVIAMPSLRAQEQKKVDKPDLSPAERLIAAAKIKVIDEILPFWERALAEYATWMTTFRSLPSNELALGSMLPRLPDGSRVAPLLAPFRQPLVKAASALFAPVKSSSTDPEAHAIRLPTVEEYSVRLQAFIDALAGQAIALRKGGPKEAWADHIDTLLVEQANVAKPDARRLLALSLVPFIVHDLIDYARRYDAAKDALSPDFEDTRAAHRFGMAHLVAFVARWLRWDDLLATSREVLVGAEDKTIPAEEREAELWLVSDWEPEGEQPISRMVEDFPEVLDTPVIHDTPITLRHLAEWFRYTYSHSLRETLEDLLRVEDFLTAETKPDFQRINRLRQTAGEVSAAMAPSAQAELATADAAAAKFPLKVPQRFAVRDWAFRGPPGAKVDWNELIAGHRKTQKQITRRAFAWIFPSDIAQGVFGWALPSLDGLVLLMKHIPTVAALAKDNKLEGGDWLAQLAPEKSTSAGFRPSDAAKARLSAADWSRLNEVLLLWLKRMREEDEKRLPSLWRRLAVLYRRSVVLRLRKRIDLFAKYPTVTHGPAEEKPEEIGARRRIPEDVVAAVYRFEPAVRGMLRDAEDPAAAAETQTALFVFGIAPSLLKVDMGLVDGYFKRHVFGLYSLAVDHATDPEKLKGLRAGTEIQDEVNAIVQSKENLDRTVAAMKEVMAAIETELAEAQSDSGFCSADGKSIASNVPRMIHTIEPADKPGSVNEWRLGQRRGPDGHIDPESGVRYGLRKVFRKFWFYPHAGSAPVKGVRKGEGGAYRPSRLVYYDDAGERQEVVSPEAHPELAEVVLFTVQIGDGDVTRIRANDVAELERLSDIFMWRVFQLDMESIAQGIQTFEEYLETVVVLIFPELALPEFIANIAQMLLSGEFDDLVLQLKNDPGELLEKIASDLEDKLFRPENLWKFLLLGMPDSPWSSLLSLFPKRDRKVRPPPTTKFGRVVAALRALGSRFNHSLHRVREYVQPPLRSVQGRIAMHPTLLWILQRAARLGQTAADLIPFDMLESGGKGGAPGRVVDIIQGLVDDKGGLQDELDQRVTELLEGIHRFELPHELIDLKLAAEIIIDFVLARFGPKGKIVRMVLETAPVPASWAGHGKGASRAMDVLTYQIKKVWDDTVLDPNKYWREAVKPFVAREFDGIRDALVDGIYETVAETMTTVGLTPPNPLDKQTLAKTVVETETLLPEGEGSPARRPATVSGIPAFPAVGGTALDRTQRARFEPALAADLSHVRLHAAEARATTAFGADAMASGSHVYLRPGVSAASSEGTRLLAHELTHVVQQTGATQPGVPGRRSPTLGRPARGVQRDPTREGVADRIAGHVARGDRVPARLRHEIGTSAGPQPSMAGTVVEGVLDVLTQHTTPAQFERGLEGRDPPGWEDAKRLAQGVFDQLKAPDKVKFANFITGTVDNSDVQVEVLKYVREITAAKYEIPIKKVAQLGQHPIKKKDPEAPDTELDPKRFLQLLANFIFAERHIALRITADAGLKSISEVLIFNIDLAAIGGNARLWDLAMKASFEGVVPDLKAAQREMRERLASMKALPSLWNSTQFRFADGVIKDYVAELKAREVAKVSDVPPVNEYFATDSASGQGLAVSTHGQLTKRRIGQFGRESHHTTQYLLIEYFSNNAEATQKAFPEPKDFEAAGVRQNPSTGEIDEIRGAGGAIQVAALNPNSNRGAEMPAILLSARCHQRGELHVLRESRWINDEAQNQERRGTPTQGIAIENTFNRAIADPALRPRDTSPSHRSALRARIATDPIAAQQQYYSAALDTYHWMRKRMLPALKEGLLSEEMAYYRGIAAQKHGDLKNTSFDLGPHHLTHVHDVAVKNNDQTMSRYGWKP